MITIEYNKNKIKVMGHSEKDICAAVSAMMYLTINNLLDTTNIKCSDSNKAEYLIEDNIKQDYMLIEIKKHNQVGNLLIKNLINALIYLEKDYPKDVKLKELPI